MSAFIVNNASFSATPRTRQTMSCLTLIESGPMVVISTDESTLMAPSTRATCNGRVAGGPADLDFTHSGFEPGSMSCAMRSGSTTSAKSSVSAASTTIFGSLLIASVDWSSRFAFSGFGNESVRLGESFFVRSAANGNAEAKGNVATKATSKRSGGSLRLISSVPSTFCCRSSSFCTTLSGSGPIDWNRQSPRSN